MNINIIYLIKNNFYLKKLKINMLLITNLSIQCGDF